LLAGKEIVCYLDLDFLGNRCFCDIPGNNETWKKEEGPAVLATPVATGQLKFGEEFEAIVDRFERSRGRSEFG